MSGPMGTKELETRARKGVVALARVISQPPAFAMRELAQDDSKLVDIVCLWIFKPAAFESLVMSCPSSEFRIQLRSIVKMRTHQVKTALSCGADDFLKDCFKPSEGEKP